MDGSLSIAAHHQGGQYTPDHHLRRGHRTAYGSATIIVTSATASYTRWLAHLHRNLKFFGRGDQLTVCAEDEPTADFARSRGLRVLQQSASSNALDGRRSVGETYMTQAWYRLVHGKQFCVWGLLARSADGATILLLDGDITLFRDPLPVLPPVDLAFMDDRWRRTTDFYNSGFFMVRASAATRAFGKLILFGEHFVVYKVPALVAAVAAYTDCDCEFTDEPGLTGETRRMQTHAPETM